MIGLSGRTVPVDGYIESSCDPVMIPVSGLMCLVLSNVCPFSFFKIVFFQFSPFISSHYFGFGWFSFLFPLVLLLLHKPQSRAEFRTTKFECLI